MADLALVAQSPIAVSAGGVATTDPIDTTGADFLLAAAACYSSTPTVSDSAAHTWVPLTLYGPGFTGVGVRLFYVNHATPSATHTLQTTAGLFPAAQLFAFSGARDLVPFDGEAGAAAVGASLATGSVTPSLTRALIISAAAWQDTLTAAVTELTLQAQATWAAGNNMGLATAFRINGPSRPPVNPLWTFSGSHELAATVAVFLAESSAVPDPRLDWQPGGMVAGAAAGTAAVASGFGPRGGG